MDVYGVEYKREGYIGLVRLNRPERLNTFNVKMFEDLEKVMEEIRLNIPRAVILTGAGQAFSAGFDVNPDNPFVEKLSKALERKDTGPVAECIYEFRRVIDGFVNLPVPVIAAINGEAYGGGAEFATRCDIRIMDPEAEICFSEVTLGLMPDWGGGATLAKLLGCARAAELILTARKVNAREAVAMGLANRISRPGEVLETAREIGEQIAANGPLAVRHALEIIRGSVNCSLEQNLEKEAQRAVDLIATGECIHGITAFLQKTDPKFPDPAS